MSDLFGAPPAPAPAPPPARRARAPRAKAAPAPDAPAQVSRPAEEQHEAPPAPAAPPAPSPPRQYGPVLLHDGRQVDSGSEEWRRETLARHLLTLAPPERDDWLAGWPPEAAVEMRLLMRALRATDRVGE